MKFGEKLQKLRKQRGLSQEQLAAQLTVSRQAVSKWELDDTMPDTENVIQLSRLFGVSCDYLLRDEVNEQGAPLPTLEPPLPTLEPPLSTPVSPRPTPGEAHLTEQGWIHNAFVLALGVCAIGLVFSYMGLIAFRSRRLMAIGCIIQILGMVLFELAVPRMGGGKKAARLSFYAAAAWLVLPIPIFAAFSLVLDGLLGWQGTVLRALTYYFTAYILSALAVTAALLLLRQRICAKR
ncbi:MAG: helix-turn-helix transcriptional regulator [Oscillospiraceae bacterium]|jgi:DNA-binding XRE family transcriptional regulator|nr:helix-turn-helix transcriptional regulator [Oscillospiraceae bacterium]